MEKKSAGVIRLLDLVTNIYTSIAGLILCLITVIVFCDVILRKFFGSPTTWGFSVTILGMMWFVLLAMAHNIKEKDQITVTLLVSNLSEKTRTMLEIVTNILSLVFILVLGYYGFLYTLEAQRANITSTDLLSYPVWILRLAFPVGALLGFLQMLRIIVRDIVKLAHRQLPAKQSWIDNPYFIIPLFLILLVAGTVLLIKNPVAGTIILIFLVLFGGMPIAFGMGFIGVAGLFICYKGFVSLSLVPVHAEPMLTNFIMLAVPMFIFAGTILEKTKIGELIFDFSAKWVGFLPGGLAVATVMACAIFSAMTGVSMAVAATISLIAVEALSARGYPKELIYGSIGGGALGSFIPPSIGLVIYGYLTGTSVARLFLAASIPALIVVILYSLYVVLYSLRDPRMQKVREQSREQVSWKERFDSLKKTFPALLMPVIVLGGIYAGFFTPTEASSILVIYALILGVAYRKINLPKLVDMIKTSTLISSRMMIVAAGAIILTYFLTRLGVAQKLALSVVSLNAPNWAIFLALIVMYIILGMFFDGLSITIVTVPVLAPVLPSIGLDPHVFGVLLVMLVETAAITPPVGMNLFVIQSVSKDKLSIIAKGNLPFAIILILATLLVMFVPELALWLPGLLGV
jgi:C4-dicarboxylate transporter DctM subunit